MRYIFSLLFLTVLTLNPHAYAQTQYPPGDLGDILDGIFKGQQQYPFGITSVDNIPVDIRFEPFESQGDLFLVVSAYAPPPPNVRQSEPRLIGQTRILMDGLGDRVQLVVAAPANITRDLPHARVSAKIENASGKVLMISRDDSYYSGFDPASLELVTPSNKTASPSLGTSNISGTAALTTSAQSLPRGGKLTIKLVEAGLAGGQKVNLLSQTEIDIDQKAPPFAFNLTPSVAAVSHKTPLELVAEITDWAGRITHTTQRPMPYVKGVQSYALSLSPINSNTNNIPGTSIQGEAQFDAYKGLPAGSRMEITVKQSPPQNGVLTTQTLLLDGLSGHVPFDVTTDSKLGQTTASPNVSIQILGPQNRLFFSSYDVSPKNGFYTVKLRPAADY